MTDLDPDIMATSRECIAEKLTPKLSSTAQVTFPTSIAEFEKVFGNWSAYNLRLPAVLVQATTESDVLEAVSPQTLPAVTWREEYC